MLVESHQFEPTPPLFGVPVGVIASEFRRDFRRQKTKSLWAIVCDCLRDAMFSHVGTVPACDGWTDGRMDRRRQHIFH